MVTIFRAHGLRVMIFVDDHNPAHVHVFGDGQIKIDLLGPNGKPALVWAENMKRSDIRLAMKLVTESQQQFLARWRDIHG